MYCSNCGEQLFEDALFCPKCGTRTVKGMEENVPSPKDELREAFAKMGQELDKAFSIAAREINAAFQTASENIQRSMKKEKIVCSSCTAKNPSNAIYCYQCGKKLEAY